MALEGVNVISTGEVKLIILINLKQNDSLFPKQQGCDMQFYTWIYSPEVGNFSVSGTEGRVFGLLDMPACDSNEVHLECCIFTRSIHVETVIQ